VNRSTFAILGFALAARRPAPAGGTVPDPNDRHRRPGAQSRGRGAPTPSSQPAARARSKPSKTSRFHDATARFPPRCTAPATTSSCSTASRRTCPPSSRSPEAAAPPLRDRRRSASGRAPLVDRRLPHGHLQPGRLAGGDVRERHPRLLQVAAGPRPHAADEVAVETLGGVVRPRWAGADRVVVQMGRPIFAARRFQPGLAMAMARSSTSRCDVDGERVLVTALSMGNPHAVLFVPDVETAPVTTLGSAHRAPPGVPESR